LFERRIMDVRVALRRADLRVSERLGDGDQIGAVCCGEACERVATIMHSDVVEAGAHQHAAPDLLQADDWLARIAG